MRGPEDDFDHRVPLVGPVIGHDGGMATPAVETMSHI